MSPTGAQVTLSIASNQIAFFLFPSFFSTIQPWLGSTLYFVPLGSYLSTTTQSDIPVDSYPSQIDVLYTGLHEYHLYAASEKA